MGKLFSMDSPLYRFLSKLSDILILTVLWIICSLPLVTIGPATTAVYYVCLKMVKNEEEYIVRSFFKSFKENLKQGMIIWLLFVVIGCILGFNYYYLFKVLDEINVILTGLNVLVTVLYAFAFLYVFPLLARYENTTVKLLINSFMISIRYLDRTIIMSLFIAAFVFLGFYSSKTLIFAILLGMGVICYVVSSYTLKIFENLEKFKEEYENRQSEEEQELFESEELDIETDDINDHNIDT